MTFRLNAVRTLCAVVVAASPVARAAEQVLEFTLVTLPVEVKSYDVANVDGQNVSLMRMRGVAAFKDGRVAAKDFVYSADLGKGSGPFYGYSTYAFDDGSTLTARFAGTLKAGSPMHGEYTVLSGTGRFAGARGSGTYDAASTKLNGAAVFNARLTISTP